MKRKIENILLAVAIIIALFLLIITPLRNWLRNNAADDALNRARQAIENTEGNVEIQVPDTDFLSVDGEDGDDPDLERLLSNMSDISSGHQDLTLLGILEIPCIDVELPIWDECSRVALRYGVGRFPESANIGKGGNTILFGHRNNRSRTMLWQLETLVEHIGEEAIITTTDGEVHRYRIVDGIYASDADIDQYLYANFSNTEQLCIATCGYGTDPYDSSIHRVHNTIFIAICEPME